MLLPTLSRRIQIGGRDTPASRSTLSSPPSAASRGFTLLELITVIALLGVLLGEALPTARNLQDRMAVVGAREAAVGLFHRARMEAVARGGSTLVLATRPATMTLLAEAEAVVQDAIGEDYGIEMSLSGARPSATLVFDALGLGRVASQTLRFTRGDAVTEVVVSSYGRVTRR